MKVVINVCFGGFSLSRAAFLKLRELGNETAKSELDYGEMYSDGSGPRKDFSNGRGPGSFCGDIKRDDPQLIKVVEEMGAGSWGDYAELRTVEIPDGVEWGIHEYDGTEHIEEKHRTWGWSGQ